MGYSIHVDCSALESSRKEIDAYISKQDQYMKDSTNEVEYLLGSWNGDDSRQFGTKWEQVSNATSTTEQFKKSLQNYSTALQYAITQYRNAQMSAIERANKLPIFW